MGRFIRRAARRDANEADIVEALRAVGATVIHCEPPLPDLLVALNGVTILVGVKAPDGPRGGTSNGRGRNSTTRQGGKSDFRPDDWQGGPWLLVTTPAEAVAAVLKAAGLRLVTAG